MARRRLTLDLDPIVAGATAGPEPDDAATAMLDAAEALLREHGLHRWSVDDVAERAGLGRTSVYRRFPSKDDLVHGVLARELRVTIAAIGAVVTRSPTVEDAVVDAALAGLRALDGSVVDRLLHTDPADVLPFLTTDAGPLVAQARAAFVGPLVGLGVVPDPAHAEIAAEALARLGLSFVVTRETVLPLDDLRALRTSVAALVLPLLRR